MKKRLLFSLLLSIILIGCEESSPDADSDDEVESAYYSDSDDENEDEDEDDDHDEDTIQSSTVYSHNQGIACLSCHTAPASEADGEDFLSGGTVYTALDGNSADKYASGHTIRLLLSNGVNINYEYESDGGTANSYSENSALSSAYNFTAQVLNASNILVNSSLTNSHNTSAYLNCNSCHTPTGNSGAPGRVLASFVSSVVNNDPIVTPSALTFVDDVYPILQASCSSIGCHNESSTNNFIVSSDTQTYSNVSPFLSSPAVDSTFLTKANNTLNHGGGKILDTASLDYITIRDWMDAGAPLGTPSDIVAVVIPTDPVVLSFSNDVMPLLLASCQSCHGSSGNFSITTASATYSNIGSFGGIDTTTPSNSSLLTKSIGTNHGGGAIWNTSLSSYITVKDWIAQGALNN